MQQDERIAIIGGGVVGLCCALMLQREGRDVVVVERGEPGESAVAASCGFVAVGEVVPLSKPGILRQVPGWLLDTKGPLRLRPDALPGILPWFLRFMASARPKRLHEISDQLAALTRTAHEDFQDLLQPLGLTHLIGKHAVIEMYETAAELEAERPHIDARRALGFETTILTPDEMAELEPDVARDFHRAARLERWYAVADTQGFVQKLEEAYRAAGGVFQKGEAIGFLTNDNAVTGLKLRDGTNLNADQIIIAAGAWSKDLIAQLGTKVSLEGVAGYQTILEDPGVSLSHPVVYAKGGFAITPQESGLAIAGTIEFSGLRAQPDYRRAKIIVEKAKRVLPGLKKGSSFERVGYRPLCPDTIPIIDKLPAAPNVIAATGHGQLGLTMGATTARIVADLAAGRHPALDLSPYRVTRF